MKKIIIAFAAVACAVAVQASTVKWNVANIYGVDSTGAGQTTSDSRPSAGAYYVFCMLSSAMSLSDAQTAIANNDIASIAAKATYQGTTTGTGAYGSSFYNGSWSGGDAVNIYAVVLNASTIDSATYATVSSAYTSYTFKDSAEDKALAVNMKTPTQGAWTSVGTPDPGPTPGPEDAPEPTSGLLMLIGAAGLALRRKRA